jgi:hypothetical protein
MIKELIEGVSDFFRCIEFSFCWESRDFIRIKPKWVSIEFNLFKYW